MRLFFSLFLFFNLTIFAEEKILTINISGNSTLSSQTILYYLGLKEGEILNPSELNKNLRKFLDTNLISDCKIMAEEVEGGIILYIFVVEKPKLMKLNFKGTKALSPNQIRDKFKEKGVPLTEGVEISDTIIQKAKTVILDAYSEIGYPAASVEMVIENYEKGGKSLTILIDEGTKVPIGKIEFLGNTVFSPRRLKWTMKKTKESNIVSALSKHNLYSVENFKEDSNKIKLLYKKYGYKDIKIGEPKVETYEIVKKGGKKIKKRLKLTIPIEEGSQFRIRNINIEGATILSPEIIKKEIKFSYGEVLNFQKLNEIVEGLQELYNRRGYITASITPQFIDVEGEKNLLDINLKIEEGDQYRLGKLEFKGNTKTMDKVLRREFLIDEGQVFNASSFKQSLFRVNQLGFFKLNEQKPVDFDINPEEKTVDMTVFGEESSRSDLQFAAGWSESEGFFGQFFFNTRNFLGRGEVLSLGYQSGKRRTFYEINYTNPYFLDTPNSLSFSLFRRSLNYPRFDRESKGFGFGYGLRLGAFTGMMINYGYEDINMVTDKSYRYPPDDGRHERPVEDPVLWGSFRDLKGTSSSITPAFYLNTKDDPFDTKKGIFFRLSTRWSGAGLGGTIDLFKPETSFTIYHPLKRNWIFAFNLEAGRIYNLGDDDLPAYERYFLGGEYSMRGFSWRSIYPTNPKDGTIGGNKFVQFNLESIWRIQQPFRFVVFLDAGNTWGEWERTDLGNLRYSTGIEFRIFLPVFMAPLRFIYGIVLDPKPGEDRTNFQFTIGTSF
ncbi:MAG: outer membrane protein assembly factor BamA [Thermoanaerobaculia bacterium]